MAVPMQYLAVDKMIAIAKRVVQQINIHSTHAVVPYQLSSNQRVFVLNNAITTSVPIIIIQYLHNPVID